MDPFDAGAGSILRQPKAVWATAGASVVAFMGIGLEGVHGLSSTLDEASR